MRNGIPLSEEKPGKANISLRGIQSHVSIISAAEDVGGAKVCFLTVNVGFDLRVLEEEWGSGSEEESDLGCKGSGFSPYSMMIPVLPSLHPKP